MTSSLPRTVDDASLAAWSAGTLPPDKQLLLACQCAMVPEMVPVLATGDHVGGALLECAVGTDLSTDFSARLESRLATDPDISETKPRAPAAEVERTGWMPEPLAAFLADNKICLKWRKAGAGVERAALSKDANGGRLYLLRARPGFSVPAHSHSGEEWTLVLSGGYHVGEEGYVAGDLHREDETCIHALKIDDDGPCISLIADEGRLRFSNPVLRLMQPLFGV